MQIPVQHSALGLIDQFGHRRCPAPQALAVGWVGYIRDRLWDLLQHLGGDVTETARSLRRRDRDQPHNTRRRHSRLGRLSPVAYENTFRTTSTTLAQAA
ncbi:hypothetical protein GCM10010398_68410 [Streptomyces fimbriatus]